MHKQLFYYSCVVGTVSLNVYDVVILQTEKSQIATACLRNLLCAFISSLIINSYEMQLSIVEIV